LGIVPKALAKGDIIGKIIGEELQVSTMFDWMNTMFDHIDAFIALPGVVTQFWIHQDFSWMIFYFYYYL
jgi:hypothetical protein